MAAKVKIEPCIMFNVNEVGRSSWAKIFVHSGISGDLGASRAARPYQWAYVSIVSDYGNWGYCWRSMGRPFWEFLPDLEFDYAMRKFMGRSLDVFDADASRVALKKWVCETRRRDDLPAAEARALFDAADSMDDETERDFFDAMARADAGTFHECDLYTLARHRPDPAAVEFWKHLWVPFTQWLKETYGVAAA